MRALSYEPDPDDTDDNGQAPSDVCVRCPENEAEHEWVEAEAIGWYLCMECGAPGLCVGCLGRAVIAHMPKLWGVRLLCPDREDGSDCLDGLDGLDR